MLRSSRRQVISAALAGITGCDLLLTEQGATDFQVNLVVLDIDGTPKPNALWMAGVSLNFKD